MTLVSIDILASDKVHELKEIHWTIGQVHCQRQVQSDVLSSVNVVFHMYFQGWK